MSAPSPPLARVAAHAGLELRLLLRSGESLLVTFAVPLGLLVFFGATDLLPTGTEDPLDFLVPGVLAIAILSTGFVAQAIQTGFERKYGVLKRLGASPLTRAQFVAGKAVAVTVVVAVQVVTLVTVAAALGWRPGPCRPSGSDGAGLDAVPASCPWDEGGLGWVVVVVAVVVGAMVFTAVGLALAGAVRAELVLAGSNAVYLLLVALSDLVFPLPDALRPFAQLTPSGALGVLLRAGLGGDDALALARGDAVVVAVVALAVLLAWGGTAVVLAARTFRWEP